MSDDHGQERTGYVGLAKENQEREADHDRRHQERQEDHELHELAAGRGSIAVVNGEQDAEHHRQECGAEADDEGVEEGRDDALIMDKGGIGREGRHVPLNIAMRHFEER